jgi:hypothetical protein
MKFHGLGFIANLKRWEEVLKVWKEKFCFLSSERFFKNEKSKSWWNLWILKVPPFQPLEQRRDVYERRKENFCPFLFFCVLDFCWKIQTKMQRVKENLRDQSVTQFQSYLFLFYTTVLVFVTTQMWFWINIQNEILKTSNNRLWTVIVK